MPCSPQRRRERPQAEVLSSSAQLACPKRATAKRGAAADLLRKCLTARAGDPKKSKRRHVAHAPDRPTHTQVTLTIPDPFACTSKMVTWYRKHWQCVVCRPSAFEWRHRMLSCPDRDRQRRLPPLHPHLPPNHCLPRLPPLHPHLRPPHWLPPRSPTRTRSPTCAPACRQPHTRRPSHRRWQGCHST